MPAAEPVEPDLPTLPSAAWQAIGVRVELVVTAAEALAPAGALLKSQLAELDMACSRFRPDSEVMQLAFAGGARRPAGALLVTAVRVALQAAADTDGLLDPTLGTVLADHGYDRDHAELAGPDRSGATSPVAVRVERRAAWPDVQVGDGWIQVPAGVVLDLGATAKAFAADRAAATIAAEHGCGVLVGLGGDIAVAGPPPAGGWVIEISDKPPTEAEPTGPCQVIAISTGGLATSSTSARRWAHAGSVKHHILDPRNLTPVISPWRTASIAAADCLTANVTSTTAIIRGSDAPRWLRGRGTPARLVGHDGRVLVLNGWPEPGQER